MNPFSPMVLIALLLIAVSFGSTIVDLVLRDWLDERADRRQRREQEVTH